MSINDDLKDKRGVILLRVSSKGQTNQLADCIEEQIPMQREFVMNKALEWRINVVKVFTASGVSGFKISQDDRSDIQEIKEMARRKEFDILLVYKFDRIGRIADETTSTCKFLHNHGVEIYQAHDGKKLTQGTHIDGLTTYIEFWKNEAYSVDLSGRVSDARIVYALEGKYSGGGISKVPYGYKLEHIGEVNKKGRDILSYVINEEEAELVRLVFSLSIDYNMGSIAIARYLKDRTSYTTRTGKYWGYSSVSCMLKNSMYKGYTHIFSNQEQKTYYSNQIQRLIIIPEERWQLAQEAFTDRKSEKNGNRNPKISQRSRLLLTGLAYCGYCGTKLTTWSNHKSWVTKKGVTKIIKDNYRCTTRGFYGKKTCEGQTCYSKTKIEETVENEIKIIMKEITDKTLSEKYLNKLHKNTEYIMKQRKEGEKKLAFLQKELQGLKKEVSKSLIGESKYNPDLLNELIIDKTKELNSQFSYLDNLKIEYGKAKLTEEQYFDFSIDKKNWIKKYESASFETKKLMLSKVIGRVNIFKDHVDIKVKITVEDYQKYGIKDENIGCVTEQLGLPSNTIGQPMNLCFTISKYFNENIENSNTAVNI